MDLSQSRAQAWRSNLQWHPAGTWKNRQVTMGKSSNCKTFQPGHLTGRDNPRRNVSLDEQEMVMDKGQPDQLSSTVLPVLHMVMDMHHWQELGGIVVPRWGPDSAGTPDFPWLRKWPSRCFGRARAGDARRQGLATSPQPVVNQHPVLVAGWGCQGATSHQRVHPVLVAGPTTKL